MPRLRCACWRSLNGLPLDDKRLQEVALNDRRRRAGVPVLARLRHDRRRRDAVAAEPAKDALRAGQSAHSGRDQGRVRGARPAPRRTSGRRHRRASSPAWPEDGASVEDWVEALAASSNDLEAPATNIQPVIGQVIAALNATNGAWLARMSGSGATCFAVYENTAEAGRARGEDPARASHLVGARGRAELATPSSPAKAGDPVFQRRQ